MKKRLEEARISSAELDSIIEFIVKAKKNTYAVNGEGGEKILEDGCKELSYEEASLKYRDRYFGFNPFAGQEIVWQNNKPIWSMNYYGRIGSDISEKDISEKEVYEFLKKALRQVSSDKPFRGCAELREGDFVYLCESEGDVESFLGTETIIYKKRITYRLYFQGGLIKD